ncbi:MAG TPA: hypothetical protein VE642_03325 [Pyrinomonadaceae bacterium]|jgi:hypothetical protein|nr:hypothetical protein [Pyrinomonadaceae bacterium]
MTKRQSTAWRRAAPTPDLDAEVWAEVNTPDICWTTAAEAVERVLRKDDDGRRAVVEVALRRFAELVRPEEVFPGFDILSPGAFLQLCYCMKKAPRACPKGSIPCGKQSCPYCLAHDAEARASGLAYAADEGKTLDEIEEFRKDLCVTHPLPGDEPWGPRTFRLDIPEGGDRALELAGGDVLVAVEGGEPRDGDICAMRWVNCLGMEFGKEGRYHDEGGGDFSVRGDFDARRGKPVIYGPEHRRHLLRVVAIERTPRRPEDAGLSDETERHLRFLRSRRDALNARDDITDCSTRFKLEKEIYDIEHPVDLDDWSAWEEGGER